MPEPPAGPIARWTARAVAPVFGTLSAVRGGRALHPQGLAATGTFRPAGDRRELPGATRGTPVIARISRGAGLPEALPDVLGLAVRLVGAHGEGRDQDLLLATGGAGAVARHLLLPARDHLRAAYSSIAPYRVAGRRVTVLALPDPGERRGGATLAAAARAIGAGGVRFRLALAPVPGGPPEPLGEVVLDRVLPAADADRLSFDVRRHGPGFQPVSAVNALRPAAYAASRRPGGRTA